MSTHWVGIGDIKVARRGEKLAAVLGSCVSVVLWHSRSRLAIMNHALLPSRLRGLECDKLGRYADESWQQMCELLEAEGVSPLDCVCHIVGGAQVFEENNMARIGPNNVTATFNLVDSAGVWIESMETGGAGSRVVTFDADSGELSVRQHRNVLASVGTREKPTKSFSDRPNEAAFDGEQP